MRYAEDGWPFAESGAVIRSGPADSIRCPERSLIQTMEPRRIVLAVVLMAAVLILNSILFPAPKVAPANSAIATDSLRRADTATVASTNPVVADSAARALLPS